MQAEATQQAQMHAAHIEAQQAARELQAEQQKKEYEDQIEMEQKAFEHQRKVPHTPAPCSSGLGCT